MAIRYRRGISREELLLKSDWLRSEITARGAAVAFEGPTDGSYIVIKSYIYITFSYG